MDTKTLTLAIEPVLAFSIWPELAVALLTDSLVLYTLVIVQSILVVVWILLRPYTDVWDRTQDSANRRYESDG